MRRHPGLILFGDLVLFVLALWLALFLRFFELPSQDLYFSHLKPFSIIFVVWAVVFYITELYGSHLYIFQHRLLPTLARVQIINTLIAIIFFYFVPYFTITPKTTLFIDLFLSFALVLSWRYYVSRVLYKGKKKKVIILGEGASVEELKKAIKENPYSHLEVVTDLNFDPENLDVSLQNVINKDVEALVIDFNKYKSKSIFSKFYRKLHFINLQSLYEDTFGRVPLDLVSDEWFLENISLNSWPFYNFFKRFIDIILAFVLSVVSLVFYPIFILLIKLDSPGPIFIKQGRVGLDGKIIEIVKFRTMTGDDKDDAVLASKLEITKIGRIYRKLRIDELPQLLAVLKGDLSLIGPRPELPALARAYESEINYYGVRHIIKPGLSGWAQIYHDNHPHGGTDSDATREKLSYDLFYVKNRSVLLDIKIILKTIRIVISRRGI